MRNLLKYIVFICLSVSSAYAQDDQWILDGGVGVFHSADTGLSETKMITLGVQEELWGPLKDRVVAGGWLDETQGKSSSGLISGQLGFEVNNRGFLMGIFTGPTIITNTDELLGGHLQFMDDIHLGIQDSDNNYMGIMYRHLSSAGIEMPNIGRDIIAIELRF